MQVEVVESSQVDEAARVALRRLWGRAFGSRFTDTDEQHAFGGVHALVRVGDRVVSHASAVPRFIRFGDGPWRTVGYLEAVATDPDRQGEGIGRRVMVQLQAELVSRWGVGLLSTGRATGFYQRLGWQRWLGRSFTEVDNVAVGTDGEHGGLMAFFTDPSSAPDVTLSVTCQDRPGDSW